MNDARRLEVSVEVPGTPEQVWEAIATGPGIEAWFMPLEIDAREGGSVSMDFGEGLQSTGTLSVWDPPHRFVHDEHGTGTATEWLVEARGGGACVVRVVTSGYVSDGDWRDELESTREGWEMFFENLRLYLTHFPGQPCSPFAARATAPEPLEPAWERLRDRLGLADGLAAGDRVASGPDAPRLAGVVERVLGSPHHAGLVLRIAEPAPGLALVFANEFRGQVSANVCGYLFGGDAAPEADAWDRWIADGRTVDLEVEVPGTPEQVWDAIATSEGIGVWFVPVELEGREGGRFTMHHAAGMEQHATVTAWEPHRRWAIELDEELAPAPDAEPARLALELLVEARSGGTCAVRLVNSGFGDDSAWDTQFESARTGWLTCLDALRVYLEHFAGRPATQIAAAGTVPGPRDSAWTAVREALGLDDPAEGDRVAASAADAPPLAGVVERARDGALTLLLEEPGPGIGFVGTGGPGEQASAVISASLFGDEAEKLAARVQPEWRAWMEARFPAD
jgi:uncharacterized protein YndB with AHSA1/START domain